MLELVVFVVGFASGVGMTMLISTLSIEFYKNEVRK